MADDGLKTVGGYPVNPKQYAGAEPGDMYRLSPRGAVKIKPRDVRNGETFTYGGVVVPVGQLRQTRDGEMRTGYVGANRPDVGVATRFGVVPLQSIHTAADSEEDAPLGYGTSANTWDAIERLKSGDEEDIRDLQKRLAKKGLLTKQSVTGSFNPTTEKALAALMYVGNRNGVPWDQVLYADDSGSGIDGGTGGGGGETAPVPYTTTDTAVSHATRKTAVSAIKGVMQSELGRAPTASEVSDFIKGLREYERDNPEVRTTTVTPKQKSNGDWVEETSTEISGGVDSTEMQAYLQDFGDDYRPKEEARYKRAMYVDMLMQMVEGG